MDYAENYRSTTHTKQTMEFQDGFILLSECEEKDIKIISVCQSFERIKIAIISFSFLWQQKRKEKCEKESNIRVSMHVFSNIYENLYIHWPNINFFHIIFNFLVKHARWYANGIWDWTVSLFRGQCHIFHLTQLFFFFNTKCCTLHSVK